MGCALAAVVAWAALSVFAVRLALGSLVASPLAAVACIPLRIVLVAVVLWRGIPQSWLGIPGSALGTSSPCELSMELLRPAGSLPLLLSWAGVRISML